MNKSGSTFKVDDPGNPDCDWETEEDEGIEYHVFKPIKAKIDKD